MTGESIGVEYPEETIVLTKVLAYTQVRDQVIPALNRQFPGILITHDECVVYSEYEDHPDYRWRGAEVIMIGVEHRTVNFILSAIAQEVGFAFRASVHEVTPYEKIRLDEHRRVVLRR